MTAPAPPDPLVEIDLPLADRRVGKVRVSYEWGPDQRLFVTTDRLSAFDHIIAGVPWKGQVLNEMAAWWFDRTADIVPNHVVGVPDPNLTIARSASPLPVEVVVRGHITGVTDTALWTAYAKGERTIYGHELPDELVKNERLPTPLITPTTKGEAGAHDVPITCEAVVDDGLVEAELWERVQAAALALFNRGVEVGEAAGLILADTKYEFGVTDDGELLLIDEMHTPDSSRWWIADGYEERMWRGDEPESLDKEVVRRALRDAGYDGHGAPPELPGSVWVATTARYVDAFERLTGASFEPAAYPADERIAATVAHLAPPSGATT